MHAQQRYCGRFAPSPSGPLHFGSLVAALGSYLEARQQQGQWRLRIEDLDPDRVVPGAADDIQRTLERYGFEWDADIDYQSQHLQRYQDVLDTLTTEKRVYACGCSRKQIIEHNQRHGIEGSVYPGSCRKKMQGNTIRSWRLKTSAVSVAFDDAIQGAQTVQIDTFGDPILKRIDGVFSYHLAVAVDDGQTMTHVVRGADLLEQSFIQQYIMSLLDLPCPQYTHLPMAVDKQKVKLSKQSHASALPHNAVTATLCRAMQFLGHTPPPEITNELLSPSADTDSSSLRTDFWHWATRNWQLSNVPQLKLQTVLTDN